MDKLLSSVEPAFLIRSAFAGLYYFVTLHVLGVRSFPLVAPYSPPDWVLLTLGSLVVGFTIYSVHRSTTYVLIEAFFQTEAGQKLCTRSISQYLTTKYLNKWGDGRDDKEKETYRTTQLNKWADGVQFMYVSAVAVALGAVTRIFVGPEPTEYFSYGLLTLFLLLLTSSLFSDARLHAVWESKLATTEGYYGRCDSYQWRLRTPPQAPNRADA